MGLVMDTIERQQFELDLASRGFELRESVYLARKLPVSALAVWAAISTPGQLNKYHAYCKENKVYKWPGVGSRDGLTYYSGLYMERDFVYWREREGYDLQIGPPPRKSAWISWNISDLGRTQCELSVMVTPILESHLLEQTKRIFVESYFGASIEVYLDSLLQGVEQFVTTGRAVEARQFGTHPVYAP
jgi:hypothetical protein